MTEKERAVKEVGKQTDFRSLFFLIGFLISILAVYLTLKFKSYQKAFIPITMFALIMGLLFEYKRISQKWSSVLYLTLGSCALGFFTLLMGKDEGENLFDKDIIILPIAFCCWFIIIALVVHEKEIVVHLTEGITLLQSLAFIYFMIDIGILEIEFTTLKVLAIICTLPSMFAIIFTLTNYELSKKSRFRLSIWSSIIMLILAIDTGYHVYLNEPIETANDFWQASYVGTQYFLLGIASIYMAQNFFMVLDFFPGRGEFFNKEYFKKYNNLKSMHIERYSRQQITLSQGLLCVVLTSAIFGLNYYFRFVPRGFAIWSVFVLFPLVAELLFTTEYGESEIGKQQQTASQ